MLVANEIKQPLSARNPTTNLKNMVKKGLSASGKYHKKRKLNEQLIQMQSISPWCIDQFVSNTRNDKEMPPKERASNSINKFQTSKKNIKSNHIIIDSKQMTQQIKNTSKTKNGHNKRNKTEIYQNSGLFINRIIKLNTINIIQNFNHYDPDSEDRSKKFYSGDSQLRKMSMTKFKQNALQSTRTKLLTTISVAENSKHSNIQPKTSYSGFKNKVDDLMNRKLKTVQIQNQAPLMFFFEAKNNRNMTHRQKNIMKIRKIINSKQKKLTQ